MKTPIRLLALCVLGLSTSANYAVAQEVIRCDFEKPVGPRSWMSEWVYVHTDPTGAHIFDGSTWTSAKGAVPVRTLKPKPKGQRYQWSLNLQIRNKNAIIRYVLMVSNDPKKKSTLEAFIILRSKYTQFARGECQKSTPTPKTEFLRWAKEQVAKG